MERAFADTEEHYVDEEAEPQSRIQLLGTRQTFTNEAVIPGHMSLTVVDW